MQNPKKPAKPVLGSVKLRKQALSSNSDILVFSRNDKYIKNYELIAHDHLAVYQKEGKNPFMLDGVIQTLQNSTRELVQKYKSPNDIVFDAGVGMGELLGSFDDTENHGADISIEYLKHARNQNIHVIKSKLEDLPYENESFNLVTSTDVLEHVIDLHKASLNITRILKKGGHLILRVPFEEDLEPYYNDKNYEFVHLRNFSLSGLKLHFERIYGLKYCEHTLVCPSYRGRSMLKIQMVDEPGRISKVLKALPANTPGLKEFKKLLGCAPESIDQLIAHLYDNNNDVFKKLEALIAKPLELNVVFHKP